MKDIFNAHQRFSIRKYSFGAASVLLGTVFLAQAQVAQAEVETGDTSSTISSEENVSAPLGSTTVESTSNQSQAPQAVTRPSTSDSLSETALEIKEVEAPKAEVKTTADKSGLQAKIAELETRLAQVDRAKAPASTLSAAEKALAEAKTVAANADATQAQVDAATKAVNTQSGVVATMPKASATTTEKVAEAKPAEKATTETTVAPAVAEKTVEAQKAELVQVQADLNNYLPQAEKVNANSPVIAQAKAALATVTATIANANITVADLEKRVQEAKRTRNSLVNLVTGSNSGSRDSRNGQSNQAGSQFLSPSDSQEIDVIDNPASKADLASTTYTKANYQRTAKYSETVSGEYNNVDGMALMNRMRGNATGSVAANTFPDFNLIIYSRTRTGTGGAGESTSAGRNEYPLTREEYKKIADEMAMWNGKVTPGGGTFSNNPENSGGNELTAKGSYEFLLMDLYGYAYEQGVDEVNITNFSKRFDLDDASKAAGWKIKSAIPFNLFSGLTYDAATDTIKGRAMAPISSGPQDIRVAFLVGKDGESESYYFEMRNYSVGAMFVKDTLPPKILVSNDVVRKKVGETLNSSSDASRDTSVKIGYLDNSTRGFANAELGINYTTVDNGDGTKTLSFPDYNNPGKMISYTVRGGSFFNDPAISLGRPVIGIDGNIAVGTNASANIPAISVPGLQFGGTSAANNGKIFGTFSEAGNYYVSIMAKDWNTSGSAGNRPFYNIQGQEIHAHINFVVAPTVSVKNIETYTNTVPVTISKGATSATVTMPNGKTVELKVNSDGNWIITGGTSEAVVVNTVLGAQGSEINIPVTKEDTQTAGVDNITVAAKAENFKGSLLRNKVTLTDRNGTKRVATLSATTGRWEFSSSDARVEAVNATDPDAIDVTERRVYTDTKPDGSQEFQVYEFTRTFKAGNVIAVGDVTRTLTTVAEDNTPIVEGRTITVTYDAFTNTWSASDQSTVTTVKSGTKILVSTSSGFYGEFIDENPVGEDKATIINSKPTATSTSYESTLNAKVDLRKAAEAAVTITDKEDDALKASNPTGELASKVTNITRITVTKPSGAQKVYDTVKAAAEYDLAADYTLDEVGVYTVKIEVLDSNTNLVDGTTVGATTSGVDHGAGSSNAETTYTITVKAAIVGNNVNSEDIQGAKQTGQPTFTFDNTEKSPINQGTKVYTLETTTATDSTGKAIGLYAIDSNTGVVTFTPNNDYVGTPTPAKVTLTVTFGNDTTGQPITAQATAEYQPVVKPVTPTAVASETTGPQGKAQTSEIKFDAADSDNTTVNFAKGSVEIDATTTKSVALDKDTVVLLDANGNKVQSVTVYEADGTTPQGTYTLDKATNQITFQPTPEFTGKATPVNIEILDLNGTPARTTYTPTVTPVTLSKEDAKSTAVQGLTQTGKPEFKTSDEKVAIKTVKLIDPTTGNETDNPVVIPNVGTYTMEPNGTVKFVPQPSYVTTDGNKTLINVRATDENGKTIDAAYEPTVTPIEVTSTPAQTIDIQGAVQNGTPTFELPETVKDVEVKAGTKVAEITGYKLIDPKDNKATEETSVTVDNVGKYTIDPSTGAVKFEPVATYTGKPTPIKVEATVTVKNEDDKTATFTAETTYTPEVVPVTPTAKESATAGKQGQKQTSKIVFDTVDRDATTLHFDKGETSRVLNTDGTAKSVALDKATVTLLDASENKTTTVTVYEADGTTPQGTYTLVKGANDEYTIEFQPTPEFTGVATPVEVQIADVNGTPAKTTYTPTVIAEDGSVVVEYVEYENGTKKSIEPTETVVNNEKVTTAYTTIAKQIPGYKLVRVENPEGTTKDDDNKVSGKVTDGTTTITYVYEKIKQKATLSYFDITTGSEVAIPSAPTEAVEGESGKAIDFTNKEATIQALLKAGYEVVTDEFQAATTSDRLFDNDEAKDQSFKVLVKQRILPVTPTTPDVEPGVPVTPTDPANWPESVKDLQKQLTKEVTRTIKYRYISRTGEIADVDVVQTVKFTREAKVNIVTGAIVEYTDWKQEGTAGAVTSPVKTNYSVDRAVVEAANITADSENSEEYVIYTPLAPTATPAVSTDIQGKTQEGTPTYKHADGTELKPSTSNPARFVGTTNTTVPATKDGKQVGTFTLDPNSGKVTFVPNKDFVGTVDPVGVEVTDPTNKEVAKSTYTPTVTPVTPTGVDTTSTGPKGQVQNGTPTFVPGHKDVPMDNTVPATFEDGTTTKVVPGEGTYVVDPSGKVTFTPEPNYVGTTNGVTVVRKDINGTEAKAKYTPTVYDVKADQQVATITYKDSKGNILGKVDIVQGDSNTAINYSTAARIKALQDQGYKLVSDNFTKQGGQTFDNDTKVIQEFVVVVSRPTTSFITKDNKEIPGYPTKDGELPKETIDGYHFIKTTTDKDGNITHVYNKITTSYVDGNSRAIPGHPTEDGDKPAKPIPGYHFTGKTTTDSEGNITHIYNKITTSYVTENSNPIPGYPTKDGELPKESIPGYEFVRTVVDPETGNITHVYKRVEAPAKKVITSFVDQDGNILRPSKDGQHPAEAIPGYVLVDTKTDADGNITHIYAKLKPTTPTQPATPATPTVQPTSVKPAPASAKQLPNTGTENHAGLAALGLAGLLGGLGLISRKKKED